MCSNVSPTRMTNCNQIRLENITPRCKPTGTFPNIFARAAIARGAVHPQCVRASQIVAST